MLTLRGQDEDMMRCDDDCPVFKDATVGNRRKTSKSIAKKAGKIK
jgi:hypothetical protein